jgi:hypothetical protein
VSEIGVIGNHITGIGTNQSGWANAVGISLYNVAGGIVHDNYLSATGATDATIVGGIREHGGTTGVHYANNVYKNITVKGVFQSGDIVLTANLPAAGASRDGLQLIEDGGAGDRNLIIYAGGQRFRIDGGANV